MSVRGESHQRLEDFFIFSFSDGRLKVAVGDWANNLVGGPYSYPEVAYHLGEKADTLLGGGVIGSILARETIRKSELSGLDLIYQLNKRIRRAYEDLGLTDYYDNRALTFTGYLVHLLVDSEQIKVTAVGDVRIACDGIIIAGRTKRIDDYHSQMRKEYIKRTGDHEGAYHHIRPSIIRQYRFQNTPGNEFSYPAIDGTETLPREEIEILSMPTPKRILVWSDGFITPDDYSIAGLENKLKECYEKDPHRYKDYPAVGYLRDDKTALEIVLDNFEKLEVSN